MPSPRISNSSNNGIYFLTLTVKNWYYLFDRHHRWDILAASLRYCQKHKALKIYHYVFMLNHIHLIIYSPDVSGFVRDFKRFTARELLRNLERTEPTVLTIFEDKNDNHQFWKNTNMPVLLETEKVYQQKAQYIESNPIMKGYVARPEYWIHSSACADSPVELDYLDDEV